jgi:hypothetical protein
MEDEIAIADRGDAAKRIDGEKLRSFVLALSGFEKLPFIRDALYLSGEQNPPRKRASRDPIDLHGRR